MPIQSKIKIYEEFESGDVIIDFEESVKIHGIEFSKIIIPDQIWASSDIQFKKTGTKYVIINSKGC